MRIALTAAIAAAALAFTAQADANVLGKSNGITYALESTKFDSGTSKAIAVKCPKHTVALSGGPNISGQDANLTRIAASYPSNARTWKVVGWYTGAGKATLASYVVCMRDKRNHVRLHVNKTASDGVSQNFEVSDFCKKGAVTGGGFRPGSDNPMNWWLSASAPFDFMDDDDSPDDAWDVTFHHTFVGGQNVQTYSICLKDPDVVYVVQPQTTTQTAISLSPPCTADRSVICGGFTFAGFNQDQIRLTSSRMIDSGGDGDTVPDDAWLSTAHNDFGNSQDVTASAICL